MKKVVVVLLSICLTILMSSPALSATYTEDFSDPLGNWTTGWFYLNTNAENYYVANGNCDPNNRGNNPSGIWITDDRGCGNFVAQSPVVIYFGNNFGDNAVSFSIDVFTCNSGVTLNIYDRNGSLDTSVPVSENCTLPPVYLNYNFTLTNGISAFEFAGGIGQIEGNTAIDNVTLVTAVPPVPTMNQWGMLIFIALAGIVSAYQIVRQRRATN